MTVSASPYPKEAVLEAMPFEDGMAACQCGDYATAMGLWRPFADQGHADAQFYLGNFYEEGLGVPQDDAAAASWYRKAADQGHADAQCYLGGMYDEGWGVPQDYAAALIWYRKAGDQMELDNLGSAESFTLTVSRLPEGKFSVRSGTSQIETVILADHVLELGDARAADTCVKEVQSDRSLHAPWKTSRNRFQPMTSDEVTVSRARHDLNVTTSRERMARLRRRRKLGQQIVNGIRISDSEIEELRNRGYEGDLVEAIETFLSDLLV